MTKKTNIKTGAKPIAALLAVALAMMLGLGAAAPSTVEATLSPEIEIVYNDAVHSTRDANGNVVFPILYNGTTYVPVRGISNILGVGVDWDSATRTVLLDTKSGPAALMLGPAIPGGGGSIIVTATQTERSQIKVTLSPDISIKLDGTVQTLKDANGNTVFPILYNGTTYLPVRGISTLLGIKVEWDADKRDVLLGDKTSVINSVIVNAAMHPFTPDTSGIWMFATSNEKNNNPYIEVYDPDGNLLAAANDGGWNTNSLLFLDLDAGKTYVVNAGYFRHSFNGRWGDYKLTATRAQTFPGAGGEVRVIDEAAFTFTPGQSGRWTFRTSDNGSSDPYLSIYDAKGVSIGSDNNSGGSSNASITRPLEAGVTYIIHAECYNGEPGSFTLNVTIG